MQNTDLLTTGCFTDHMTKCGHIFCTINLFYYSRPTFLNPIAITTTRNLYSYNFRMRNNGHSFAMYINFWYYLLHLNHAFYPFHHHVLLFASMNLNQEQINTMANDCIKPKLLQLIMIKL